MLSSPTVIVPCILVMVMMIYYLKTTNEGKSFALVELKTNLLSEREDFKKRMAQRVAKDDAMSGRKSQLQVSFDLLFAYWLKGWNDSTWIPDSSIVLWENHFQSSPKSELSTFTCTISWWHVRSEVSFLFLILINLTKSRSDQSQSSSSHRVDSDRQGVPQQQGGQQQHERLNRQINRPDGFPIGYNPGRWDCYFFSKLF